MKNILQRDESDKIMGGCFEVSKEMGCGFLEAVYQECLEIEFSDRKPPYIPKQPLELSDKERRLKQRCEPDFVCFGYFVVIAP